MRRLCNRCPTRTTCRSLCPNALHYAEQDTYTEDPDILIYAHSEGALDYLSIRALLGLGDYHHDLTYWDWVVARNSYKLSRRQRRCFYLYHWKRLTTYQIAHLLSIPQSNVVKHIHVASSKLEIGLRIRIARRRYRLRSKLS